MDHLDELWEKTTNIFPILNNKLIDSDYNQKDFVDVIGGLCNLGISETIYEAVLLEVESKLRQEIVPTFWKGFQETGDNEFLFCQFQYAVYQLQIDFLLLQNVMKRLKVFRELAVFPNVSKHNDANELETFDQMLKVALLAQLPANFNDVVYSFYNIAFKVFVNSHQEDDEELEDIENVKCNGCSKTSEQCRCQDLVMAFNKTNLYLANMNLLDRLAGYTLTNLIQEQITNHVQETCNGIFEMSHIKNLEKWLETIVINWLTRIYNQGSLKFDENNDKIRNVIKGFNVKLGYYLYETYAHTIIEQFFNIIIDFPDSQPAIDDLKLCLERLDLRQYLIKSLKQSLETRLLHPGVNTHDILTGYVAAIKAIRHLDSSGVLLETVTEPVKQYMRSRNDTVRCVVTALTEEGPTDLIEELAKSEALAEDPTKTNDEMTNWETWNPDPIDVNPKKERGPTRSADIISMVVDIYGSKELFVIEYRNLLADRLLSQLDFNPEKELRNLELLKLRFGESLLHSCEVMLKDIGDSKRINAHINNDSGFLDSAPFGISSLILSSQFWPTFKNGSLEIPEKLKENFEKYTRSYEAYKGNRTLCWRSVIGRVHVIVHLANKTLELHIPPTQAVILYHFQEKSEWTLDELSQIMKVPPTVLRKRISLLQSHGIIKEQPNDVFVLLENATGEQSEEMQTQSQECEDDETESAMASASDQREEELQVFWSYIVGMLTNLDSLPLERIHQMLKMFASHGPGVEFSQEELKNFLQRKVRQHELIFASGVYQLPK